MLACGALLERAALGPAVPGDVSVVRFDDLDVARQGQPRLTTVRLPTEQEWSLVADYLLARLGGITSAPVQREIDVELVVRASAAALAGPPGSKPNPRRKLRST